MRADHEEVSCGQQVGDVVTKTKKVDSVRETQIDRVLGISLVLVLLTTFLGIHIWKDFSNEVSAWYFHSTWVWLLVMALASAIFFREYSQLKRSGADVDAIFSELPPE